MLKGDKKEGRPPSALVGKRRRRGERKKEEEKTTDNHGDSSFIFHFPPVSLPPSFLLTVSIPQRLTRDWMRRRACVAHSAVK